MTRRRLQIAAVALCATLGCAAAQPTGVKDDDGPQQEVFAAGLAAEILDAEPAPPELVDERWRLTYFHRLGSDEALLSALDAALAEQRFGADPDGTLEHFFAAALSRRPFALGALERKPAAGADAAVLAAIVRAARDFSSPAPTSPAAVDALWAEYRALGERRALTAIAGVLLLPPAAENERLVRHAALSLARNIPVHGNLDFLEEAAGSAEGRQRQLLRLVLARARGLRDEADGLADRGDNLLREGQPAAAVEEFHAALRRYPAYYPAYTSLGRHYERTGNLPLALRSSERALFFAGEDPFCLTNLGRVLYRLRLYPEALAVVERSLRADPGNAYGHYLLGLVRTGLRDHEGAVSALKRGVELDPNADCSADARRRLAAMSAALPDDPANLVTLLRRREYAAIEARLAQLLASREKDEHGKLRLRSACDELAKPSRNERAFAARLRELQDWVATRPDSHFALVCTGSCLVEYGYFGRGGGYAPTVTELGWKLFRERLEAGRTHLERAFAIDPSDPVAPDVLIWAATGLSLGRREADLQIERATAADPAYLEAHLTMLTYLLPRWHGSHEEMLAYARGVAADAPPGSAVPRVLCQAHHLIYKDLLKAGAGATDYFKDPEVWGEVQDVYARVLADFPGSTQMRNWYAKYAYLAGEHAIAREQFRLIGEAWYNVCWDSRADFEEARRAVFAAEGVRP